MQAAIWRELLRVQTPKRWALDLDVEPSQITRWGTGERAFGPDDQAAAERVALSYDRRDIVQRIRRIQDEQLGDAELLAPVPCPMETARECGHLFAQAVDALLAAGDGIATEERIDLTKLHTELLDLARKVETLATRGI